MAQSQAESTWEIDNYGKYIIYYISYIIFLPNIIKSIRQYERINLDHVYYIQRNLY